MSAQKRTGINIHPAITPINLFAVPNKQRSANSISEVLFVRQCPINHQSLHMHILPNVLFSKAMERRLFQVERTIDGTNWSTVYTKKQNRETELLPLLHTVCNGSGPIAPWDKSPSPLVPLHHGIGTPFPHMQPIHHSQPGGWPSTVRLSCCCM